jgi:hypothetical protein
VAATRQTIRQGLIVGLIGYASVAAFYGAFDLLAARGPLYTVDLLGKALFRGLRDPSILGLPIPLDRSAIVWYNAFHLLVSLLIGLVVTGLVVYSDRHPTHGPAVLFTIVAGFVVTIVAVGSLTAPIRPLLPWWSIVAANALAVLLAGTYLLRARPGVWSRLNPFAG